VDLVTMGDHVYKKAEIIGVMQEDEHICRPANFPVRAPGRIFARMTTPDGTTVAATCVLGRTYMRPVDCPFEAADAVLTRLAETAQVVIVDAHAEATADKYLLGHHLNGRVTAVLGTHTHVPTADEHIMSAGTAFICDVGMTGPHESILGRRVDRVLSHALSSVPTPFEVAEGDVRLNGAIVTCDARTGRATAIERLVVRQ
jgi:metallophosphoesterase (TIGR00282 family)